MTGELGKKYLKEYIAKTDDLLVRYYNQKIKDAKEIGEIPAGNLQAFVETVRRGKRIRGALMTLGYYIAGGKDTQAITEASLCVELFHAGALVHDDIMDKDSMRRGLPSMHYQFSGMAKDIGIKTDVGHYGISQAINLADGAFYMSWEILLNSKFSAQEKLLAGQIYTDYVLRVVNGQELDVANLANGHIPKEAEILNVLKYKTAEYTGIMPLYMGGLLGGMKNENTITALKEYGLSFGWAFQIQDDILGIFSDEEEFGKPVGSDLREGKNTLLTLYVQQNGTPAQKTFLKQVLGNENITKDDVLTMREIFIESGALKHTLALGWKYVSDGKMIIPKITKEQQYADLLESLIVYMMERAV